MSFLEQDGFLPCPRLFWKLQKEYNLEIGELNLNCFKAFKETNDFNLVADSVNYLFRYIEEQFSEIFFNYISLYYDSISDYSISKTVHKDITYKELKHILKTVVENKAKELINSGFTYIKLSQLLQARIYVRSLNNCRKLKVYDIDSSPYELYILEGFDKKYLLQPFERNFDWRTKEVKQELFITGFIKWLDETASEEFCEVCKKATKIICCTRFHKQCFGCLNSFNCVYCNELCLQADNEQVDQLLTYFYCKKP